MTSREDRRRAEIQAEYQEAPAPRPSHSPGDDERPLNARRALTVIAGTFQVDEAAAVVWDLPRWRTVNPDDVNLSYVADQLAVYHLKAYNPAAEIGVQVMYLGGKVARSWLGRGVAGGEGSWESVPVASLAKTLREALV